MLAGFPHVVPTMLLTMEVKAERAEYIPESAGVGFVVAVLVGKVCVVVVSSQIYFHPLHSHTSFANVHIPAAAALYYCLYLCFSPFSPVEP